MSANLTEDQITHMVDRFLAWRLPEDFQPDAGVSFKREFNEEYMASLGKPPMRHQPTGTNLFDARQAREMILHMVEGMEPLRSPDPVGELVAAINEADACFEAAMAEGWIDAIENGDVDRIRDLWARRISHARTTLAKHTADARPSVAPEAFEAVAQELGGVANLLEHRMSTETGDIKENSRQAAESCRRIAAMLSARQTLPASGGEHG